MLFHTDEFIFILLTSLIDLDASIIHHDISPVFTIQRQNRPIQCRYQLTHRSFGVLIENLFDLFIDRLFNIQLRLSRFAIE